MAYGDKKKGMTTVKLKDDDGKKKPVTFKKGALHKALGVPESEDLPKGIMEKIKKGKVGDFVIVNGKKIKITDKLKKQAVLGLNLSKGSRK